MDHLISFNKGITLSTDSKTSASVKTLPSLCCLMAISSSCGTALLWKGDVSSVSKLMLLKLISSFLKVLDFIFPMDVILLWLALTSSSSLNFLLTIVDRSVNWLWDTSIFLRPSKLHSAGKTVMKFWLTRRWKIAGRFESFKLFMSLSLLFLRP